METSLFNRVRATLLAIATAALLVLAVLNLIQDRRYDRPDDGIWWRETAGGLLAERVLADMPGQRAGIEKNDLLTAVGDSAVTRVADLERALYRTGSYGQVNYSITRDGIPLENPVKVIPVPLDRNLAYGERVIGLIYLIIGFYVLFRRWGAPRSTHFYLFCLTSFAWYSLKYTGVFDALDTGVFWVNVLAESLQPALFLHFALSFPEERFKTLGRRWLLPLVYAPGAGLLGLWLYAMHFWQATGLLKLRLDQTGTAYDAVFYILAALLFLRSYSRADSPLLRQQLKWVTRGTLLAVLPFTLFYAAPFLLDLHPPQLLTDLAGLSLVFLPLTFSWAIVRYRLMDTDLIFKRGVAYTLATGLLIGGYFGVVALVSMLLHNVMPEAVRDWGLVIAVVSTAVLFDPLKRRVQGLVDRAFDRHRYDYRKALVEFGRGLSSETDLGALLNSIVEQLPRTLRVARVAVFMSHDSVRESGRDFGSGRPGLRLAASHGLPPEVSATQERLSLGFLDFDGDFDRDFDRNFDRAPARNHIFLENAQHALHLGEEERRTAALLDLNYYLPCRVASVQLEGGGTASRTIAVIGLGRTLGGDFLSSEDVELLESLASYIGIALQNASLYARLEDKIGEFERLKEFNENIVESINVGILAVDLNDRIESWNAQMEAMYALSRAEALGQGLRAVFPAEFIAEIERVRNEQGVHHLYKFPLTTRAGEQRTANIAVAPLLSRNFVPVGRIILVDDITERVSLESQLAQADKLSSIGLLAAGVAHEINTPLAVISSYAQMLSKQLRGDDRLGPVLDKITQQSFRAAEIANGLLNFSRTSTTEFKETNLNQVIRDTLSLLEHQFKTANIAIDLDLADGLPAIHGNPGKLQQVFLNLLMNAKDAMPSGGNLRVTTLANGHVEARIADSGTGIAPEHLKRIYDPFFTTKTTPRPGDRRGTGLGLSVSYGIIQEHAGKIHVESAVGAGTTFQLQFPLLRSSVHA